jgi:NAD(P)-dependent dehydrogenase (short-subunit alcohol dehydrogenase family)
MSGRTCLVTGATAGIGEETARGLARLGASVVVVARSEARCAATVTAIRRETGNESVGFLVADLSTQAGVRQLAREFLDRHDRLHVLVNNVGAMFDLRRESLDGIEMTLALNHLGPFLLTNLLLDVLERSAPSRIVNVSSDAHRDVGAFDLDDPEARSRRGLAAYGQSAWRSSLCALLIPTRHPAFLQYAQTKLANLLFTYELARRLAGTGVTANALHPGFVASSFMAGNGVLGWCMRRWAGLVGKSAEDGAKTPIWLASSPEVADVTGRYFTKQRAVPSSPASLDDAAASRLWELSEAMVAARS